jgi:hypothetical protein
MATNTPNAAAVKCSGRKASLRRLLASSLEAARLAIVRAQKAHDDLARARAIVHAAKYLVAAHDALAEATGPNAGLSI